MFSKQGMLIGRRAAVQPLDGGLALLVTGPRWLLLDALVDAAESMEMQKLLKQTRINRIKFNPKM